MKACIWCTGFFLFSIKIIYGQEQILNQIISTQKQTTTLYDALNLISQKTGYFFIYDSETVKNDKVVKLRTDHLPMHILLDRILMDSSLGYKVLGRHILIFKMNVEKVPITRTAPEQEQEDAIRQQTIRGHIFDRQNKAAIPFATIGIPEGNTGTVSNFDGFFTLKIPSTLSGASLVVSHVGYTSQTIPVQLINEQLADIYLERKVISIQEVIIQYIDPSVIIEKAMALRGKNYPSNPVYLTAFYREGVQKNDQYISYTEAVFKVYKPPFNAGNCSDQVKLLKSRKFQNADSRDTVILKLKAGVQSAIQLDIVKNIPAFLDQTPTSEYKYTYSGMLSYHDRDAYSISFKPEDGMKKALFTGKIFIDRENFAILGADFEVNPACLDVAAEELVLKKSPKLIVRLEKISYSISFLPFNNRYYLHHVRCDIQLKTRLKHHFSTDHFNTFLEFANCHTDTTGVVKFPKQEILKPNVIFSDQPYNPKDDFWGDWNTITPEVKLSDALSGIMKKLEEIR